MEAHLALVLGLEGRELGAAGAVGAAAEEPGLDDVGQRGRGDVSIENLLGLRTIVVSRVKVI